MAAISNAISKVVSSATGSSSGTTLQDFLSHFASSSGKLINTLDPFATFDVSLKFYPTMEQSKDKKWYESLLDSAKSAVNNAANNVTGGLLGSIMNNVDVKKQHDNFSEFGQETFLEYLASANLLAGQEDWIGETAGQMVRPLELQLGLYCQEITLPTSMALNGGSESETALAKFPVSGTQLQTDSNEVTLKLLNTKVPLHERIFYPWLREISLPYWSYNSQPYTTATMTIDFTKHSDIKYVFCGCRPSKINLQAAQQQVSSGNLTRDVSFTYDYMFITSDLNTTESLGSKLLSTAKNVAGGALNMVNA